MEVEYIRENTILVFKEVFKGRDTFSDSTSANDILEWDSLNHMVLINSLEKKFNIKFDIFKLIDLRSVGDFINYITQKLSDGNKGNKNR